MGQRVMMCLVLAAVVGTSSVCAQEDISQVAGYTLLEDIVILQRLQEAQVTGEQAAQILAVVQDYLAGRAGPDNPNPCDDPLTKDVLARAREALLSGPLPADLEQQVQQVRQALEADRQRRRQVMDYAAEQLRAILSEEQLAKLGRFEGAERIAQALQGGQDRIADVLIDQFQKLKNLPDNEWEASLNNTLQQQLGRWLQPGTPMYERLRTALTDVARRIRGMTNADIEANREALRVEVMGAIRPQQAPGAAQPPQPAGAGARPREIAARREADPAQIALRFLSDYRTVRVLTAKVSAAAP
jgi:hypothetical protein